MFTFPVGFFSTTAGGGTPNTDWSAYAAANNRTPSTFNSASTPRVRIEKIDATHALILYTGTSTFMYARIATMDGSGDCTYSAEVAILSEATTGIALEILDSTHAVAISNSGTTIKVVAFDFTTSGVGTPGSAVTFETGASYQSVSVAKISATDFYVYFTNSSGMQEGYVTKATVSGTTVTEGTRTKIFTNGGSDTIGGAQLTQLTATQVVLILGIVTSGNNLIKAYLISGSTPASSSTIDVDTDATNAPSEVTVCTVDATHILCVWSSIGANHIKTNMITESGGTLIANTTATITSGESFGGASNQRRCAIAAINTENALFYYRKNADSLGRSTVISISGATLTTNTIYTTPGSGSVGMFGICALTQDFVVAAYTDVTNTVGKTITFKP